MPDVQKLITAEVDAQPTHADAGAKGGRGNKASDNITGFRGTGRTHTLKRLKRDAPALFGRIVAAGFMREANALRGDHQADPEIERCRKASARGDAE
jgi:hypothetical protein